MGLDRLVVCSLVLESAIFSENPPRNGRIEE